MNFWSKFKLFLLPVKIILAVLIGLKFYKYKIYSDISQSVVPRYQQNYIDGFVDAYSDSACLRLTVEFYAGDTLLTVRSTGNCTKFPVINQIVYQTKK